MTANSCLRKPIEREVKIFVLISPKLSLFSPPLCVTHIPLAQLPGMAQDGGGSDWVPHVAIKVSKSDVGLCLYNSHLLILTIRKGWESI